MASAANLSFVDEDLDPAELGGRGASKGEKLTGSCGRDDEEIVHSFDVVSNQC